MIGIGVFATGLAAEEVTDNRRQQLIHLLKHDCGACHGLKLTGGLGPALTPATTGEIPLETLRQTILHGRPGTPMPPFAPLLSSTDVDWLIARLRTGAGHE